MDEQGELDWSSIFKNVGRLPATDFVSVVKKIEVRNDQWNTPHLTNADLPSGTTGVIPTGAEVPQGSEGITVEEVNNASVAGDKYLYVWGRAKFMDGFDNERYVNFCHRYPLATKKAEATGPGFSISAKFARYHQSGNRAD